jgi:RNA polymerase sigma-B factor
MKRPGSENPDDPQVDQWFAQLPDPAAREQLTHRFLPLAEHLARRFGGRGQSRDDLLQVASLGLIHAIDRFDPSRGVQFGTYATATIVGELKRHFRDRGWDVRVPRSVQEATIEVNQVMGILWQELGRAPTVGDISERTGLSEDRVLETLDAAQAYASASLDAPVGEDGAPVSELMGDADPGFEVSDEWLAMAPMLQNLAPRERQILYLRFFKDMTQTEIAEEVGISQMHVSRLLSQSLARLRDDLDAGAEVEEPTAPTPPH